MPEFKAQHSLTDPKSRSMKGGGFDYSFNAQTAIDGTAHIIKASEMIFTSSDLQQVHMVLDAVKTNMGAAPG